MDDSWAGVSVTAPLKQAVIPFLADTSDLANRVGAVNTIVRSGDDASWSGHNTDVHGIVAAFGEVERNRIPGPIGIVGAGGTAAAALAAADQLSASITTLCARRTDAAHDLAARVAGPHERVRVVDWENVTQALGQDRVIVTLPGDAAAPLVDHLPARPGTLLDVTYHPWPTTLAAAWQERGGRVIPGHRMLLWQAAEQVRLMTGQQPPVDAMSAALTDALKAR